MLHILAWALAIGISMGTCFAVIFTGDPCVNYIKKLCFSTSLNDDLWGNLFCPECGRSGLESRPDVNNVYVCPTIVAVSVGYTNIVGM